MNVIIILNCKIIFKIRKFSFLGLLLFDQLINHSDFYF